MDDEAMIEAADLIENFRLYWDRCADSDKPEAARQQLLQKIVERVFVHARQVSAVAVHGELVVSLGENVQVTD